jgi:osmotically-inducible protein OsmY
MSRIILAIGVVALVFGGSVSPALSAEEPTTDHSSQGAPDNTERNVRDRNVDTMTPFDQSENPADLALTQKIRQALMQDDSLSMTAKNVKIMSTGGSVTLRGPVANEKEKTAIAAKAQQIAGNTKVDNQLEIKGQ